MKNKKIIIIGGGVIGLSIGWQLTKSGADVTIYDSAEAGRAASWAAAGMLAPFAEAHTEEPELLKLGCESLGLYPKWVSELESDAEMSVGFRVEGTLIVGLESDDTHQLRHLYQAQQQLGLSVNWLSGGEVREIESALSPRVTAAIQCESDYQVDNRLMVTALKAAFQKNSGVLHENYPIQKIHIEDSQVNGIETHAGFIRGDIVILSAGCWSSQIDGIPDDFRPPVRPGKRTNDVPTDGGGDFD